VHEPSTVGAAAPWPQSRGRSRLATVVLATLAGCAVAFAALGEGVAGGELVSLDRTVAMWLHAHATGFLTALLSTVTALGGTEVLLAVTLAVIVSLLLRRRVGYAALMGAALAGGQALNWALKAAFERPRPSFADPLATATGFSFPSGHAMVSLTVYGALAFVFIASAGARRARPLALSSAIGLVLAIGFSRVYLGVHYPTDVLAAYSAGLAWLTLCALSLLGASQLRARRRLQPRPARIPEPTARPASSFIRNARRLARRRGQSTWYQRGRGAPPRAAGSRFQPEPFEGNAFTAARRPW
jgi:membrane-associated phospholipid phosphatase